MIRSADARKKMMTTLSASYSPTKIGFFHRSFSPEGETVDRPPVPSRGNGEEVTQERIGIGGPGEKLNYQESRDIRVPEKEQMDQESKVIRYPEKEQMDQESEEIRRLCKKQKVNGQSSLKPLLARTIKDRKEEAATGASMIEISNAGENVTIISGSSSSSDETQATPDFDNTQAESAVSNIALEETEEELDEVDMICTDYLGNGETKTSEEE